MISTYPIQSMATNSTSWQDALASLIDPSQPMPEPEQAPAKTPAQAQKGRVHLAYERKGRGGKEVTIIGGLNISTELLAELASTIKSKLGTGGSVTPEGEILIQGDRRNQLCNLLPSLGFKL